MAGKTLYEKIWDSHVVHEEPGKPALIYIDRHLIHEGTSPQAFAGLRAEGRTVRRPDLTFAVMDHSVPTISKERLLPIVDEAARLQFEALEKNCKEFGVRLFDMHSANQGIVHVIGPELGITQPGQTMVCGDSHTSTHGAFGTLAFGIGTSEVEHVLATQCLVQSRSKTMNIVVNGKRPKGVTAKDIVLAIIGKIGISGGNGHVVEYSGEAIRGLSMDGRMTVCNMTIEGGARAGMVAPDETTFAYLEGRPFVPRGEGVPGSGGAMEVAGDRQGREVRHDGHAGCEGSGAAGYLGDESGDGERRDGEGAGAGVVCRSERSEGDGARAAIYGIEGGDADRGYSDRSRVYRVVHEFADR